MCFISRCAKSIDVLTLFTSQCLLWAISLYGLFLLCMLNFYMLYLCIIVIGTIHDRRANSINVLDAQKKNKSVNGHAKFNFEHCMGLDFEFLIKVWYFVNFSESCSTRERNFDFDFDFDLDFLIKLWQMVNYHEEADRQKPETKLILFFILKTSLFFHARHFTKQLINSLRQSEKNTKWVIGLRKKFNRFKSLRIIKKILGLERQWPKTKNGKKKFRLISQRKKKMDSPIKSIHNYWRLYRCCRKKRIEAKKIRLQNVRRAKKRRPKLYQGVAQATKKLTAIATRVQRLFDKMMRQKKWLHKKKSRKENRQIPQIPKIKAIPYTPREKSILFHPDLQAVWDKHGCPLRPWRYKKALFETHLYLYKWFYREIKFLYKHSWPSTSSALLLSKAPVLREKLATLRTETLDRFYLWIKLYCPVQQWVLGGIGFIHLCRTFSFWRVGALWLEDNDDIFLYLLFYWGWEEFFGVAGKLDGDRQGWRAFENAAATQRFKRVVKIVRWLSAFNCLEILIDFVIQNEAKFIFVVLLICCRIEYLLLRNRMQEIFDHDGLKKQWIRMKDPLLGRFIVQMHYTTRSNMVILFFFLGSYYYSLYTAAKKNSLANLDADKKKRIYPRWNELFEKKIEKFGEKMKTRLEIGYCVRDVGIEIFQQGYFFLEKMGAKMAPCGKPLYLRYNESMMNLRQYQLVRWVIYLLVYFSSYGLYRVFVQTYQNECVVYEIEYAPFYFQRELYWFYGYPKLLEPVQGVYWATPLYFCFIVCMIFKDQNTRKSMWRCNFIEHWIHGGRFVPLMYIVWEMYFLADSKERGRQFLRRHEIKFIVGQIIYWLCLPLPIVYWVLKTHGNNYQVFADKYFLHLLFFLSLTLALLTLALFVLTQEEKLKEYIYISEHTTL